MAADDAAQLSESALIPGKFLPITCLLIGAAVVRFSTLDVQSYWDDEGSTLKLLRLGFLEMLGEIPNTERIPHLYYVLAWSWSHAFGTGEVGLRSFSALAGTATVYLMYVATRTLSSHRAGLVAGAITAANPLLIWYSQEARAYALLTCLVGATFVFYARALERAHRLDLWWWALAGALSLLTHYFAVFIVAPQALILIVDRGRKSLLIGPLALLTTTAVALLPLAEHQRAQKADLESSDLPTRLAQVPEQLLVGYGVWYTAAGKVAAVLAAAAAAAGILLALGDGARQRRAARALGVVAVFSLGAPVLLVAVDLDYVSTRYLIGAALPCIAFVALGLARSRAGVGIAAAYCLLGVGITAVVAAEPSFQRQDLRGAAEALGATDVPRAIVVSPTSVLSAYVSGLGEMPRGGYPVAEVAVVALTVKEPGQKPVVPRRLPRERPAPGFVLRDRVDGRKFTVIRFEASHPVRVVPSELIAIRLGDWPPDRVSLLLQRP